MNKKRLETLVNDYQEIDFIEGFYIEIHPYDKCYFIDTYINTDDYNKKYCKETTETDNIEEIDALTLFYNENQDYYNVKDILKYIKDNTTNDYLKSSIIDLLGGVNNE